MPSHLAYDFKARKFTKCAILASRFIEWESEEERVRKELVDMSEGLDERIDREFELEEQLEEAKAKYRSQRNVIQAMVELENRGTKRYRI